MLPRRSICAVSLEQSGYIYNVKIEKLKKKKCEVKKTLLYSTPHHFSVTIDFWHAESLADRDVIGFAKF